MVLDLVYGGVYFGALLAFEVKLNNNILINIIIIIFFINYILYIVFIFIFFKQIL